MHDPPQQSIKKSGWTNNKRHFLVITEREALKELSLSDALSPYSLVTLRPCPQCEDQHLIRIDRSCHSERWTKHTKVHFAHTIVFRLMTSKKQNCFSSNDLKETKLWWLLANANLSSNDLKETKLATNKSSVPSTEERVLGWNHPFGVSSLRSIRFYKNMSHPWYPLFEPSGWMVRTIQGWNHPFGRELCILPQECTGRGKSLINKQYFWPLHSTGM